MQQTTNSNQSSDIEVLEAIPASGEPLTLLIPLAAPAIAWVARATVEAIAKRRKAKVEDEIDNREYLQQQNDLLLRRILKSDEHSKSE